MKSSSKSPAASSFHLSYSEKPLLFVDTETTGLQPGYHEIIEIACILTDNTGKEIYEEWVEKIHPQYPERLDPAAQAVNGYNEKDWSDTLPVNRVMSKVSVMAKGARLVGHNIAFDWEFIQATMSACGVPWLGDYHKIDTVTIAHILAQCGCVSGIRLGTVVNDMGMTQENAHTALSDARDCRKVYIEFMERCSPAIRKAFLEPQKETLFQKEMEP